MIRSITSTRTSPITPLRGSASRHSLAPDKPFFVYYSPGLTHAPHHAPTEWIAKFKGQFDQGWDKLREETLARQIKLGVVPPNTKLTPRPKEIPSWDSRSAEEKKLFAHMMEVYAGCLAYVDYNIGRVLDAVEETGDMDNTLIIYEMGDNGASGEGTSAGPLQRSRCRRQRRGGNHSVSAFHPWMNSAVR